MRLRECHRMLGARNAIISRIAVHSQLCMEKSLLCDPGSELRLGGREKRRANTINEEDISTRNFSDVQKHTRRTTAAVQQQRISHIGSYTLAVFSRFYKLIEKRQL